LLYSKKSFTLIELPVVRKCSFTLIELLVVIAIIGILASMSLTSLNMVRQKAKDARVKSGLSQVRNLIMSYADIGGASYTDLSCSPTSAQKCDSFTQADERANIKKLAQDIASQLNNASDEGLSIAATANTYQTWAKLPSSLNSASSLYQYFDSSGAAKTYSSSSDLGLIGWWKLDETSGTVAADSSVNNFNGTFATVAPVTGKIGGAIRFSDSSILDVNNFPSTITPSDQLSISMWVNMDNITSTLSDTGIIMKGNSFNYGITRDTRSGFNGRIWAYINGGSNNIVTTIPTSSWQYIVFTYNRLAPSNNMKLYINGNSTPVAIKSYTTAILADNTGPLTIGYNLSGNQHYKGVIDDVRIYNRELAPTEITNIYNGV